MTPQSFDNETCAELLGDTRKRSIEAKGRARADAGEPPPERLPVSGSYWSQVGDEADYRIELTAYQKRLDRIARMSVANGVAE